MVRKSDKELHTQVELAQLEVSAKKHADVLRTIRHVFTLIGVCGAIWLICQALVAVSTARPDSISALAAVVKEFSIASIVQWIVALSAGGWAIRERKGRVRAIERAGRLEKKLEAKDPYNSRSGLTATGATPVEEVDHA
ncbi:MotA/TolQ/ExbB proton channel family protein [Crenobacter luteus]|uniref:MotA/TolQ/ExbB proton channel family protein n=1 Tax=Crenobacter luteus TaxID=1452487 RepID=UPI0012E84999|nr:MotA/TolQ/ExbB proton channel family protein [Crenobacter luteus]